MKPILILADLLPINSTTKLVSVVCLSLQTDLEHTIGESAALGAAGVVLWGELSFAESKVSMNV